jgi:hypothetical protein
MADIKLDYPAVLTRREWDRNKGVIAKLVVGKTDVGAGLRGVEEEYNKTGFSGVKMFPGDDPLDYLEYEKKTVEGLQKSEPVLKAKIDTAMGWANATQDEFRRSKPVPKSSADYVKRITDGLAEFFKQIGRFPAKAKDELRKEYKDRLHKSMAYLGLTDAAQKADATFSKLQGLIKQVEGNPTLNTLHATFMNDGPHRQLTTVCKLWDQLVAGKFPKLAAKVYPGKAMTDYFTLPGLADIANETANAASKKLQTLIQGGQPENRVVQTYMLRYSSSVIKAHEILNHLKAAAKVVQGI